VFTATKRGADRLAVRLSDDGHSAAALHGNMNQNQRNRTLQRLRSGNVRVLVATDVAARGIDVVSISHVINYDLPKVAEDYVHRIGRTGRAGAAGIAISFAGPEDGRDLKQIERYTGHTIIAHVVEGLEPKLPLRSHHSPGPRRKPDARGRGAPSRNGAPGNTSRWNNNESRGNSRWSESRGGARTASRSR
jgi:superfamily II DNA/RNA helicase